MLGMRTTTELKRGIDEAEDVGLMLTNIINNIAGGCTVTIIGQSDSELHVGPASTSWSFWTRLSSLKCHLHVSSFDLPVLDAE